MLTCLVLMGLLAVVHGAAPAASACTHGKVVASFSAEDANVHRLEVCCAACGDVLFTGVEDCVDAELDETCDRCGGAVSSALFRLAGANMTLGNALELNFMVRTADLDPSRSYTAQIIHGSKVMQAKVINHNSVYHRVGYRIAAKEMSDQITVVLYDDTTGMPVSEPYTRSVRDYAAAALEDPNSTQLLKTMVVDMLNYGAEAQAFFNYRTDDPANAHLTQDDLLLASPDVEAKNIQERKENFYGANLGLEDRILFNVFFVGVTKDMYAKIEFTDHTGAEKQTVVENKDIALYKEDIYKIAVDEVAVADLRSPITVTVHRGDGSVYGRVTDSVESYIARSSGTEMEALDRAIMRFGFSAYQYLHGGEAPSPVEHHKEILVLDKDGSFISFETGAPIRSVGYPETPSDGAETLVQMTQSLDGEVYTKTHTARTERRGITLDKSFAKVDSAGAAYETQWYQIGKDTKIIVRLPDLLNEGGYVYRYFDGTDEVDSCYRAEKFQYILDNECGLGGVGMFCRYLYLDAACEKKTDQALLVGKDGSYSENLGDRILYGGEKYEAIVDGQEALVYYTDKAALVADMMAGGHPRMVVAELIHIGYTVEGRSVWAERRESVLCYAGDPTFLMIEGDLYWNDIDATTVGWDLLEMASDGMIWVISKDLLGRYGCSRLSQDAFIDLRAELGRANLNGGCWAMDIPDRDGFTDGLYDYLYVTIE